MFKIYDGREKFYQWDIDRRLIVEDPTVTEVHFCNRTDNCSLVCETFVEDGLTLVNVPNILLQTDWKIHVYAYDGKHTKHSSSYEVVSRTKPSDYIYTETEIKNFSLLESQIEAKADKADTYTKQEIDDKISNNDFVIEIHKEDISDTFEDTFYQFKLDIDVNDIHTALDSGKNVYVILDNLYTNGVWKLPLISITDYDAAFEVLLSTEKISIVITRNECYLDRISYETLGNKISIIDASGELRELNVEEDWYYPTAVSVVNAIKQVDTNNDAAIEELKKEWVTIFECEVTEEDIYRIEFTREEYPELFTAKRIFFDISLPKQTTSLDIPGLYITDQKNNVLGAFWTTKRTLTQSANSGWIVLERFNDVCLQTVMVLQANGGIITGVHSSIAPRATSVIDNATSLIIKNYNLAYPIPKGLKLIVRVEV